MDIFIIILVVIAAGAAFFYFMGSSRVTKLMHRQSVSTIRFIVYAKQGAEPHTPLPQIYLSIAEERNRKLPFTTHSDYVQLLRDHGCFDPVTHPQPEQFAELCATIEDKIKLDASGVNG